MSIITETRNACGTQKLLANRSVRATLQAFALATGITGVLIIATALLTDDPINPWETAAVYFSFACTWLCVKQVRFNYVLAVVSTLLLSYVFWKSNLLGSMALNLYLIPTVIYGWFIWGRDTETKPVQHVTWRAAGLYALFTLLTYAGAVAIINALGGEMGALDGWLLIGSILAQFLLDRKKIETWVIWVVVNVVSVYVYFQAGLYLLAAQFALFLVNAIYAYLQWRKDLPDKKSGEDTATQGGASMSPVAAEGIV